MVLDKKKILSIQKNRDPYLFVDYITEVIPGKICNGYKDLKEDEWFFNVHWPNDPNMPGALQMESITQTAAISILIIPEFRDQTMYVVSANHLKFFSKVLPNSRLFIKTEIINFKRGVANIKGAGFVNEKIVCSGEFNLILPDEIKKYTKNKIL